MISYGEAMEILEKSSDPSFLPFSLKKERCDLMEGKGRILAEDIYSPEVVPAFDNSAMDGFAVKADWLKEASVEKPVSFSVGKLIAAGDWDSANQELVEGVPQVVEIMTGAPLPKGYDSVVKVEDVQRSPSGSVLFSHKIQMGQNVRLSGEDYLVGDPVLARGVRLTAENMMALATLGISDIVVYESVKVALVSTGKELVPYKEKVLKFGMIRNSTAVFLRNALMDMDAEVLFEKTIADKPEEFKEAIETFKQAGINLVISTGAVSMGTYDFIKSSLQEMGADILFHKVAIRPGKPVLFGKVSGMIYFGLPGNPISTAVGLRFFVEPFFRWIRKQPKEWAPKITLKNSSKKPEGLTCFFKGYWKGDLVEGVEILPGQASFMVSPLVRSNSWVVLGSQGSFVHQGDKVDVYPLRAL